MSIAPDFENAHQYISNFRLIAIISKMILLFLFLLFLISQIVLHLGCYF